MKTNKAEEYADNKFTPKAKQYAATSSIKAVYDNCIEDFNAGFNSRQSEIDYLTKESERKDENYKGLNALYLEKQNETIELNKEVEMLRQERSTYLLSFIEWSKAVDEYGNKLDYADVNNFLTTH